MKSGCPVPLENLNQVIRQLPDYGEWTQWLEKYGVGDSVAVISRETRLHQILTKGEKDEKNA